LHGGVIAANRRALGVRQALELTYSFDHVADGRQALGGQADSAQRAEPYPEQADLRS
jgi:hypothetical protein